MSANSPTATYTRNAVLSASRARLVSLMYEGAIRFVEQARYNLDRGNTAACGAAISRAYNVVSELKVALDFEAGGEVGGEIASNLDRLYGFAMDALVAANVERSREKLDEVLEVLKILEGGWSGALLEG